MKNYGTGVLVHAVLMLLLTGCFAPPNPDVHLSSAPEQNSFVSVSFSAPHPIAGISGTATYRINNYKSCMPPYNTFNTGMGYPNPFYTIPLSPSVSDNSIHVSVNTKAIKDENYYNKGQCIWGLFSMKLRYSTTEPIQNYHGKIRYANGKYPVDYCVEEQLKISCCNREGSCQTFSRPQPINPEYYIAIDLDGSAEEFDLECNKSGCFMTRADALPSYSAIDLKAHVVVNPEPRQ